MQDATSTVRIELVTAPTADVRDLLGRLDEELGSLYPPEQRHGLDLAGIFQPHVRFFVARRAGLAVGCAGVALFAEYAELKRAFVAPSARGAGIVARLVERIEAEARSAGLQVLMLETGERSAAAIRAYTKLGFTRCDVFGPYVAMPPQALASSVFMSKAL